MPRLFSKIKSLFVNQFFWMLDYTYVTRQQLIGAVRPSNPSRYRNHATLSPSIILIPGIYENWQFMTPIANLLHRHGYDVHVIEALGYNRGNIEVMADIVHRYITSTDTKEYIVVAHSKGGLIGKYLLTYFNDAGRIKGLIALNTPFTGSSYAYLFLLFRQLRIFTPRSAIVQLLSMKQAVNAHIVSIYGKFDPHIPGGSKLAGAKNIQLNTYGHFRIMNDTAVHDAIVHELQRIEKDQDAPFTHIA